MQVEGKGGISEVVSSDSDCDQMSLALWRGQSQSITCKMVADRVDSMTQARIAATLEYTYIVSGATQIEVIGSSNV